MGLKPANTGSERFTVSIQRHWLWLGGGWRKDAGMSLRFRRRLGNGIALLAVLVAMVAALALLAR